MANHIHILVVITTTLATLISAAPVMMNMAEVSHNFTIQ
ncbi:CLUMA_CG008522, isoform A, partial [Clunio marinus]